MGRGASVLGELRSSECSNIFDSFDSCRTKVSRKQLISIYSQTFLERELEPVTACNSGGTDIVIVFHNRRVHNEQFTFIQRVCANVSFDCNINIHSCGEADAHLLPV